MNARIILDNRVRLDEHMILPSALEELLAAFTHRNPQRAKLKSMGLPYWGEPAVIKTWSRTRRGLSFPRGGLARVRTILARHGTVVDVVDRRVEGTGPRNVPDHRVALYPHQADAIDVLADRECCIVRAPTGSGKSTLALALIARLKLPSLIVVWSGALFQQWQERVEKELGMRSKDIGIVRGGVCKLAPVTIAMQQTIAAHGAGQLRDYFGLVVLDECFTKGSLILMEDGTSREIGDVQIGDRVACGGRVLATMSRSYTGELFEVGVGSYATSGHPIATEHGWLPASMVSSDHTMWYACIYEKEFGAVSTMWGAIADRQQAWVLPKARDEINLILRGELFTVRDEYPTTLTRSSRIIPVWGATGMECWEDGGGRSSVTQPVTWQAEIESVYREDSASDAATGCQSPTSRRLLGGTVDPIFKAGGSRGDAPKSGRDGAEWEDRTVRWARPWERRAANRIGIGDDDPVVGSWVCLPIHTSDASQECWVPGALQDRFGERSWEDCGRDRRRESSGAQAPFGRQEEDGIFGIPWVVSNPISDTVRLRRGGARVRSAGRYEGCVYNLETENGVYVAGGALVHNCQRSAAASVQAAIDPFPAKYRIGISADERRRDKKEFVIHDLFGDVAVDIKREDLIESKHVLDVEVRVVPTEFDAPWFGFDKSGDARTDLDFDRLLGEMTSDDGRNALAIKCVLDEVTAGEQVLLMSHRREHCQRLAEKVAAAGVRVGLLIGGADYAKEFMRAREGVLSGALRVGVGTYQAIGTGVDLPRVGVAVCATPIAGNRQFFGQVRGRVCRVAEGKSDARLWYLWDRGVYITHLRNLSAWNERVLVLDGGKWHDARSWWPGAAADSEEVANAKTERGSGGPERSERIAVDGRGASVPGVRR